MWPSRECFHQGPAGHSHFLQKYLVILFTVKWKLLSKAQQKPSVYDGMPCRHSEVTAEETSKYEANDALTTEVPKKPLLQDLRKSQVRKQGSREQPRRDR